LKRRIISYNMAKVICRKCGKVFNAGLRDEGLCSECRTTYTDKYHQVREYLWEHPNTKAAVIAKEFGVSVHQVMLWVREERFEVSDESKIVLFCVNCGQRISTGMYCAKCAAVAAKEARRKDEEEKLRQKAERMQGVSVQKKSGEDGEMRYLGNNDK
jgi:uncharacterized protein YjcR